MKETPRRFCYVETEFRGYSGDGDYVISGELDLAGTYRVIAHVWELKAPQCAIFQKDNEHRMKPTKDLIDAENKLLHFYNEIKESSKQRDHFSVFLPAHVRLGGIIIGSNRTKATGYQDRDLMDRLYRRAIDARMSMYIRARIVLVTWDQILDQLKPTFKKDETITSGEVVIVTTSKTPSENTFTTFRACVYEDLPDDKVTNFILQSEKSNPKLKYEARPAKSGKLNHKDIWSYLKPGEEP